MDAALYSRILAEGAWINLSSRAKWRLSGGDRIRYLNGQVTQDVRPARADRAVYACVTNVKGKIEGDVFIHASPDGSSLLLDAPADLRDDLGLRLDKYIIADDALLEDITDEWQIWHRLLPGDISVAEGAHSLVNETRFRLPGQDLWLPAGAPPPKGLDLSAEDAETLRILQKVPAFPQELNSDTFPQEAGLETTAMSFNKGCYIGQEILSRIKTTGKMPRQVIAWTAETELPVQTALLDANGKEIGSITSVAVHPQTGQWTGLAMVRQSAAAEAAFTTTAGVGVTTLA